MPKTTHRLTAVSVTTISKLGLLHADGAGLYLKVGSKGARSWVFRYMRDGMPRYLGLGYARTVKLSSARGLAGQARQQLQNGLDPIEVRKQALAKERRGTVRCFGCDALSRDSESAERQSLTRCTLIPIGPPLN